MQAEEVIDHVVKEAISKPWMPLPLGLKPPSTDSVLAELSRQGISSIPPHNHFWRGFVSVGPRLRYDDTRHSKAWRSIFLSVVRQIASLSNIIRRKEIKEPTNGTSSTAGQCCDEEWATYVRSFQKGTSGCKCTLTVSVLLGRWLLGLKLESCVVDSGDG